MPEPLLKNNSTGDLMDALSRSFSIRSYIEKNSDAFISSTVSEVLNVYVLKKGVSKATAIRRAELNERYGYQIFDGNRKPSRDILLCLSVGLTLTLEETQILLKTACTAPLYPRNKRDSIIMFGLNNCLSLSEINENLYSLNEKTL